MATPFGTPAPRVACPACGAAIHPVASRCRHCRVEIRTHLDGPRAAAAAAPPRRASRVRPIFIAALMVVIAVAAAVPLALS